MPISYEEWQMKIKTIACFFLLLLGMPCLAMGTGAIQVVNKAKITTSQPRVKIWLNDEYKGEIKNEEGLYIDEIKAGGYILKARSPGFKTQSKNIRIRDGEIIILSLDFYFPSLTIEEMQIEQDIVMPQEVGTVIFRSIPLHAYIYLDGKRVGQADKKIKNVATGFHTVGFAFKNQSVSGSFEIKSDEVLSVTGLLKENEVVTEVKVAAVPEDKIIKEEVEILAIADTHWKGSECNDYGDCWEFEVFFNKDGTLQGNGGIVAGTTWIQEQNLIDLMSMETGKQERVGRLTIVNNSKLEGWEKEKSREIYLEQVEKDKP
jgi:hypothetical protein